MLDVINLDSALKSIVGTVDPPVIYAGIGSRETPREILVLMEDLALVLARKGFILRSGGARGADSAFETGVNRAVEEGYDAKKEIFHAKDAADEWIIEASRYHPAWSKCNEHAKKLHGRNVAIILGPDLNTEVDFVVCWTWDGQVSGGTGLGMRVAEGESIPVFNLRSQEGVDDLAHFIKYAYGRR